MLDDSLDEAIKYIKSHIDADFNFYCAFNISHDVADKLYNLDDKTYQEKVGIDKQILFFYLSKAEQIKHLSDLDKCSYIDIATLPSAYDVNDDNHYSILLDKLFSNHLLKGSYLILRLIDKIEDTSALEKVLKSYFINFPNEKVIYETINIFQKLEYEQRLFLLTHLFTEVKPINIRILPLLNEINQNDAKELINKVLLLPDQYIIDLIDSNEFLDFLNGFSDENYKDNIIELLISKSHLFDPESRNEYISKYVSILNVENLAKFIEKNMPSKDFFDITWSKLSSDKKIELHNSLKNNPEYRDKYYSLDYFEFIYEEMSEEEKIYILHNYVFIDNSNFNDLEKCSYIYNAFSNDPLLGIDVALDNPNNKELIARYFYELLEGNDYSLDDVLAYKNIWQLIEDFGISLDRLDNLSKLIDKYGDIVFKFFRNKNIINLINMDYQSFDKFLSLFDIGLNDFDMKKVDSIANAMLQRKFRIEKREICTVFGSLQSLLNEKSDENLHEVINILNKINKTIDVSSYCNGLELEEFANKLFNHEENSLNLLHNITDSYIAKERELYLAENYHSFLEKLNLEKVYNKQYLKKAYLIHNDINRICRTLSNAQYVDKFKLSDEEKALCDNVLLIKEIIQFRREPKITPLTPQIKNGLNILDRILDKLAHFNELRLAYIPEDAKFEYYPSDWDKENILNIMSEVNTKQVFNNILNNDRLTSDLIKLFSKYSFLAWNDTFSKVDKECDLTINDITIAYLITYYDKVDEFINNVGKNSLNDILDIASVYASSSNRYAKLINEDNYRLIVTNPGPNTSSFTKQLRLELVPSYIKKIYQRNEITIPSGEFNMQTKSGNEVVVSIGDVYDPMVLTYGERTGACLRIGGVFNDLFEYCLENKNGFHIRVTDPKTGAFISRVSGMRNGNTVFLNELRFSVLHEYRNEDLIEVINEVAKLLVESTRNDPHPIENVIISNDLVMSNETSEFLSIWNPSLTFNNLNFNITTKGHVLYTANEDPKLLMPYKLGDNHTSVYTPYNSKVVHTSPSNIVSKIHQVHMINELLNGVDIADIELPNINTDLIQDCIYGNGWVVYLDKNNKLHSLIVESLKNNENTIKTIDDSIKKYFGGKINEQNKR